MKSEKIKIPSYAINPRVSKIWKPLLVLTIFFAVIHYFIYQVTTLSFTNSEFDQVKFVIGLIFLFGVLIIPIGYMVTLTSFKNKLKMITWYNYSWLGFFHLMFHFSLVEFALQIFFPHPFSYWVLSLSVIIGLWAIYKGMKFPKVNKYKLKGNEKTKGLKIAQISDLHIGMLHLNEKWLQKVVDTINEQQPDIVAITGDLVEGPYDEISPQLEPLRNIKSKYANFYITGNHEYIHNSGPWEQRLKELGFTSLHNSAEILKTEKATLLIAGVPDRMVKRFINHLESNPDKALSSIGSEHTFDYKILLAHEPASAYDLKKEKCDVILSGHTHGGQIFPFWFYVRAVQPVVKGFKKVNSHLVFAHQGTGFWGPPMRWFSESEIAILEIHD